MKKIHQFRYAFLFTAIALVLALACGCSSTIANWYENGHYALANGDYEEAEWYFSQLGEYRDSVKMTLYTQALGDLKIAQLDDAEITFQNLGDFKNSRLYLAYIAAERQRLAGDYQESLKAFTNLGGFWDSRYKAQWLTEQIPRQRYAQGRMQMGLGEYEKARDTFTALKNYEDSVSLAKECAQLMENESLKEQQQKRMEAQACAAEGTLAGIQKAVEIYQQAGLTDEAKLLTDTYGKNLALHGFDGKWQYVQLGAYPQGENGESLAVTWRVLEVKDGKALVVTEQVLTGMALGEEGGDEPYDAGMMPIYLNGTLTDELFSAREQLYLCARDGEERLFLLTQEDMTNAAYGFDDNESRMAEGTIFALANGVHASDEGYCWYWLATPGTRAGKEAVVYYNGYVYAQGVSVTDAQVGIRPAALIDLDKCLFTGGDGTREKPFSL